MLIPCSTRQRCHCSCWEPTEPPSRNRLSRRVIQLADSVIPLAYNVIQPVMVSTPADVRQRNRNCPSGIGSTEKHPISSAVTTISLPDLGSTLISAGWAGTICPTSES